MLQSLVMKIKFWLSLAVLIIAGLVGGQTAWATTNVVTIIHSNGTETEYTAAADTDVARGTALKAAVAAAVAGDLISMPAQTFDLGTDNLILPDQTSLIGAGMNETTINSEAVLSTAGPIIVPGSESVLADFGVVATGSEIYQAGVGWYYNEGGGATNPIPTSFSARRIKIIGDTDGFFFRGNEGSSTGYISGCEVYTKYDAFRGQINSDTYYFNDTTHTITGPSYTGLGATGLNVSFGVVHFYGGTIGVSSGAGSNTGVSVETDALVDISGTTITTTGLEPFDLINNGGTLKVANASYNASKTTGDITVVPESAATFSTISIASDNADSAVAEAGDTITLTLVTSAAINSPTVFIADHYATVVQGVDNQHWTASVILAANDPQGQVGFSVYATDLAEAAIFGQTASTDGSLVRVGVNDEPEEVVPHYSSGSRRVRPSAIFTEPIVTLDRSQLISQLQARLRDAIFQLIKLLQQEIERMR